MTPKNFPERVWEQGLNGLWHSRMAGAQDHARRAELIRQFDQAKERRTAPERAA